MLTNTLQNAFCVLLESEFVVSEPKYGSVNTHNISHNVRNSGMTDYMDHAV